jgi:uncharacterized protein (TIGR00369 family)
MNKQPNSNSCFVCGVENPFGLKMKFYNTGPGEVRAEYIVPRQFQGYPGVVHGGVLAAMLDEVAGRAVIEDGPTRFMVTAQLNIRYRKPVPLGTQLQLTGRVVKRQGKVATCLGEIRAADGALLVEAEVVVVDIPSELAQGTDLEALGWKVYPD